MEATQLYRLSSLDPAMPGDDPSTDARIAEVDTELDAIDDRLVVAELLSRLPPRERRIVYLRFFDGLTQAEIADALGISQMHVSRLLTRSLETLGQSYAVAGGT
jgi:RNA polymerase sigma-B factor